MFITHNGFCRIMKSQKLEESSKATSLSDLVLSTPLIQLWTRKSDWPSLGRAADEFKRLLHLFPTTAQSLDEAYYSAHTFEGHLPGGTSQILSCCTAYLLTDDFSPTPTLCHAKENLSRPGRPELR